MKKLNELIKNVLAETKTFVEEDYRYSLPDIMHGVAKATIEAVRLRETEIPAPVIMSSHCKYILSEFDRKAKEFLE